MKWDDLLRLTLRKKFSLLTVLVVLILGLLTAALRRSLVGITLAVMFGGILLSAFLGSFLTRDLKADMEARKAAEEKVKESYQFLQTIIDGVAEPIMVIDPDYMIKLMNLAAKELAGEGETRRCHEMSHHDARPCSGKKHPCPLEEVRRTGEPVFVVHEHHGADGKTRFIEILASPLLGPDGSFQGVIETQRDITDRKRAEEELKDYTERLEEANRLKDLFTDVMRHDLMNPLQVMTMSLDALKGEGLSEEGKNVVNILEGSLEKTIDLVENAATFERLESARELDMEALDLTVILEHSVKGLVPLLGDRANRVVLKATGEYPITASLMLSQVFTNLISNALKYSPEDFRVEVGVEEEDGHYKVFVKDRGEGIPDEFKESIFERFKRKAREGVKGTGLGLAIAKRIVELHGGSIWVEDNPEGGSIFYVRLPKGKSP